MSLTWLICKPEDVWLHSSGDLDADWLAVEQKGSGWEQEAASSWYPEPGCDSGTVPGAEHGGGHSAAGAVGKGMKGMVEKCLRQLLSTQEFPRCNTKNFQSKHKQLLIAARLQIKRWNNRLHQLISMLIFGVIQTPGSTALFFLN